MRPGESASTPILRVLSDYVTSMSLDDIPEPARAEARLCMLDTLGCTVAGTASSAGRRALAYAERSAPDGPCTVFGLGRNTGVEHAVFTNAALAHALEMDDGHRPSDNHLGCAVVSAALAVGEYVEASPAEVLRAVVLGYDVMGRIGQATCKPRRPRPIFHSTATTAVFGSAAAAGVLLGLSSEQLTDALSIATTGAAGLREVFVNGTDCKPIQVGRGAQTGIMAALLAECGLAGPTHALEGQFGYLNALGGPMPEPELITSDLGTRFAVVESTFKIHAVCGMLFTPIDAAVALREELALTPQDIERAVVAVPSWVAEDPIFGRRRPPTPGIARFSVPFAVAAALKDGEVGPRQISEAGIVDPVVADLEGRVDLVYDDEEVQSIYEATKDDDYFFHPAAVTVVTGGAAHRRLERTPRGYDPNRRLTTKDVVNKFCAGVEAMIDPESAEACVQAVLSIEQQTDLSFLARARPRD